MVKRNRRTNNKPMQVYTVPSLLRPTYSVPINVDLIGTGTVIIPNALRTAPYKVTSFRGTFSSNSGAGSVTITLGNGQGGSGVATRPIASGGNQEIVLRNSKFVNHSTTYTTPAMSVTIIGAGAHRLSGVLMVSFLGTFI